MARREAAPPRPPDPAKCARCTRTIAENDAVIFQHGDLFHRVCWMVLIADACIANARQVASLAVERLKHSQQRASDTSPQP